MEILQTYIGFGLMFALFSTAIGASPKVPIPTVIGFAVTQFFLWPLTVLLVGIAALFLAIALVFFVPALPFLIVMRKR